MLDTPQSVCRVRVVGDPGVGKSSLINRFVSGHFSQVMDPMTLCTIVLSSSMLASHQDFFASNKTESNLFFAPTLLAFLTCPDIK